MSRFLQRLIPTATAVLLIPAAASAQQPAGLIELHAGHAAVAGQRLAPGTQTLRMIASQGGQEMEIATVTEELSASTLEGRAVLQRVQTIRSAMLGTLADTVVVDAATLAPIRHRSHNPQRVMTLDFAGRKVTGSVAATGGETVPVSAELDVAVFDSNPLDLVIRALPLAEGYGVRVPVYIHELGGKVVVEARVVGSEAVELDAGRTAEAWIVEISRDGNVGRIWIAKETREVLKQVITPAPGVELRIVR